MIEFLNTLANRLACAPHSIPPSDLRPHIERYSSAAVNNYSVDASSIVRPDVQRLIPFVRYTEANSQEAHNWEKVFAVYLNEQENVDLYDNCRIKMKRGLTALSEQTTISIDSVLDIYEGLYLALNNLKAVACSMEFAKKVPEETRTLFLERLKKFYEQNKALEGLFVSTYQENKQAINAHLRDLDRNIENECHAVFVKLFQVGNKLESEINLELMKLGIFDDTLGGKFALGSDKFREVYRQHCAPYSVCCCFNISSLRHTKPAALSFFTSVQNTAAQGLETKAVLGMAISIYEAAGNHDHALQRTIDEWLHDVGMPSVVNIPQDVREACIGACNTKYGLQYHDFADEGSSCLQNLFGPRSRGYSRLRVI